ncbi:VOC family protein [Microbacterium sp. Mu-80]|uniref:VOC family protein n=1 Tax=Microbacterium bandirmense TaxID=3122050 RepID=A0ABU8L9Q8_9MICO
MTKPFHQVAYVVRDLDAAVRHWADVLGVGPWSVWTVGAEVTRDQVYGGQPASFRFRHALAWSGEMQFELVEPLDGPSIFADQLERSGPGLNHVGRLTDDHAAESAALVAKGCVPLQSATFGESQDGRFAYFATPENEGILELISPPTVRFAPDYVYPIAGATQ